MNNGPAWQQRPARPPALPPTFRSADGSVGELLNQIAVRTRAPASNPAGGDGGVNLWTRWGSEPHGVHSHIFFWQAGILAENRKMREKILAPAGSWAE